MSGTADLNGNRLFIDCAIKQANRAAQPAGQGMVTTINHHHCLAVGHSFNLDIILTPRLIDDDKGTVR